MNPDTKPDPEHAFMRSSSQTTIGGLIVRPLGATSYRLLKATKNPMAENAKMDIESPEGMDAAIGYLYIHAGPQDEVINNALNPDPIVFQKAALKFCIPLNIDSMLEILTAIIKASGDALAGMVEPKQTGDSTDPNGLSQPG